ncbi:ATP-binding protein [candidate division CSSED10-310 bacterium]|uniref:ATP-binding protein n=1 Tax=candidate division CSSED10-310 bacterium TaxID=2855610 RepID=A0ABV6YUJ4_UNCC1
MSAKKQTKTITLNIDLRAKLTGFDSARTATPAHYRIMKRLCSPLLMGPPPSDGILELVMHIFTEDEADVAQYLPIYRPRTAQKIAALCSRSMPDVEKLLDNLAFNKFVILATGKDPRKYTIVPIIPGAFELALMTKDISTRNSWHKKFAEIFERLWDKGDLLIDYISKGRAPIRYLPVGGVSKTLHLAWPSDKLEEILDRYDLFAVGNCQCRLAMQLIGKGCGRPLENCTIYGPFAVPFIKTGLMRKSSRQEIIDIKRNAEENGCITWMINELGDPRGSGSCSCCGCCCHALRTISQFNTPGTISKPHFTPQQNTEKCTLCELCVNACQMGAWTVSDKTLQFNLNRCIGCGLCVLACKFDALYLIPHEDALPPEKSLLKLILKSFPSMIRNTVRVYAGRLVL